MTREKRNAKLRSPPAGVWAVVPIKRLAVAKQRLAPVLKSGREEFALRLARRTLDVLRDSALFQGLIAVTPDPRVAAEAAARGAEVVDDGDIALNAACTLGIAKAAERGADVCVLMPSDLALLTPQSLAEVIEHYRALRDRSGPESIGLVRCKDGTGTNMVLLDPQRAFEPAFGADSFARHLQGSPGRAHEMIAPAISFDIDSPADLAAFAAAIGDATDALAELVRALEIRRTRADRARDLRLARRGHTGSHRARGRAAGSRSRRTRDLLPKGVPAAHAALPGLLPLLHVRQGAETPEEPVHGDRAGGLGRGRGCAARLQGGVVYARRAAGAALPRRRGLARRARLFQHAALSRGGRSRRPRSHRLAAAHQCGLHGRPRDGDASAGVRIDGLDGGEHGGAPVREGRSALWLAGQGAGRAARMHRRGGPAKNSVHHRHLDRYRRDPGRAHRGARRDSRAPSALRAYSGDHRPELRAEAGHDHGRRGASRCGGAPLVDRGCAHDLRAAHEHSGAAESLAGAAPRPDRSRHQRLGRRIAADTRFRQPRGALAAPRGFAYRDREGGQDARRAADHLSRLRQGERDLARSGDAPRSPRVERWGPSRARGFVAHRTKHGAAAELLRGAPAPHRLRHRRDAR